MRKFYLVSSIVVGVLILIMAFAQIGSTCSLYIFSGDTPVFLIFLQTAGIGAILGGLLILFWITPPPEKEGDDQPNIPQPPEKLSTKIEEE